MKLRLDPSELDRATRHLSAQELGCWWRLATHYAETSGQVRSDDDGELKAIMGCPDTAYARTKGQVIVTKPRPWMFTIGKGKLTNPELDAQIADDIKRSRIAAENAAQR
jgi:hypothetical protein